ncbi:MAG: hypothetical protein ACRD12_02165, partial [Acidimicrobiales bacterium]
MRARARWGAGAGLVAVYAAVALATHVVTGGVGRPLFDGFAPPIPYRWVKPPPELAAGNMPPEPAERVVPLGPDGSEPSNASTADAQVIVALAQGALAAHPPDTGVLIKLVPFDAATLGPVPEGLDVVSNAYQVGLTYQPSQEPVTQPGPLGQIALTASSQGDTLLYSTDGRTWTVKQSRPFGSTHGVTGNFEGRGYYLVGASPSVVTTTTTGPSAEGGGSGPFVVLLVVVAVVGGAFA